MKLQCHFSLLEVDIEKIYGAIPDKPDLETAILNDLDDTVLNVWRKRLGRNRLFENSQDKTRVNMCTKPQHLIDLLYSSDTHRSKVTWGEILTHLDTPPKIKRRNGKEIADSVREYMNNNYMKYYYKL